MTIKFQWLFIWLMTGSSNCCSVIIFFSGESDNTRPWIQWKSLPFGIFALVENHGEQFLLYVLFTCNASSSPSVKIIWIHYTFWRESKTLFFFSRSCSIAAVSFTSHAFGCSVCAFYCVCFLYAGRPFSWLGLCRCKCISIILIDVGAYTHTQNRINHPRALHQIVFSVFELGMCDAWRYKVGEIINEVEWQKSLDFRYFKCSFKWA